jgi:hypothetical protein
MTLLRLPALCVLYTIAIANSKPHTLLPVSLMLACQCGNESGSLNLAWKKTYLPLLFLSVHLLTPRLHLLVPSSTSSHLHTSPRSEGTGGAGAGRVLGVQRLGLIRTDSRKIKRSTVPAAPPSWTALRQRVIQSHRPSTGAVDQTRDDEWREVTKEQEAVEN